MGNRGASLARIEGDFSTPRVGRIVSIMESGQAVVDFPGNAHGPVLARSTLEASVATATPPRSPVGQAVLLVFEEGDPARPIICGVVGERLRPEPKVPVVALGEGVRDVVVDGRQLVFEADQQILLRCGRSSILLRRDGKVVIRGAQLLSRASGSNRIRGGSIDLN